MAAYAALASLMNLIDQIHHHPQPPITLDQDQTQSLTEKIAFLQNFLEAYNLHYSKQEVERLRICIADAAYAAEDVIESHIVDQILARRDQKTPADLNRKGWRVEENIIVESTSTHDADKIGSAYLYQGLQKVLEEMDFIKKEVEEIREKLGAQEHLQRIMATPVISPKSHSTQHNIMVGFDDVLLELLHNLTGQPDSSLQIIPISGMAGMGKTTLARNVYAHPLIKHYFDSLAWVTISQEYNIKEILLEVLLCQKDHGSRESLGQMSEVQLGLKLYKSLYGRRYLIVMDDVWSYDVWEKINFFFPRKNKGSRIIVTTRLSNVASYLSSGCVHEMDFLDQDQSWRKRWPKTVFGEKDCPPELERIGMEIARNCKGLPLSIGLGGLLAKSKQTQEYWAYISENVSSIVKLEESEQQQGIITPPVVSTQRNTIVGFDDVLNELLHKLTRQPRSDLQIIPISGMGGIGKTTLAKNLYTHPLIEQYFDILAWVTISEEYNIKEILLEALLCQKDDGSRESLGQISEAQLGEKLYKSLYGRRYLIVMDDVWSPDVWDKVKFYFPRNNQGSRIIVTTRISILASYLSSGWIHEMDFLDEDQSWSLFCKSVFGEEDCPPELERIGMEIARNCKGLPLSIVVLGGLLAKSKRTQEYWAYILKNVSSIVKLEESEQCFNILHMSYDELPVHLKACFLYLGTFRRDSKIRVSSLISMWVAEGFLKPIRGKSLEESGEEYLMDLIDRNLVFVSELGNFEKVAFCIIHDLLRDLCIREARKERFFFSANLHDHEGKNTPRRIVIDGNASKPEILHTLQSASAARSLICNSVEGLSSVELRLLRVLKGKGERKKWLEDSFQQINLRYVAVEYHYQYPIFSSSVSHLWNLQTIISRWGSNVVAPPEIWKMPLLRHVECRSLTLPDPPSGDTQEFVLHNLHTLSGIVNLKFGEEVVNRIPNVKKLTLRYEEELDYCLNNLGHLYKLECLDCTFPKQGGLLQNLIFPHSLKELSLCNIRLSWEDMNAKMGSLPHLQVLKLCWLYSTTSEWETIQGQFCSLRYLSVGWCTDWENWTAESPDFPRLEHLSLYNLLNLKEIPDIGNIPTLKSIQLSDCSYSAIISAKQIADEQEELGNEYLQVTVLLSTHLILEGKEYQNMEGLASHNFQVKFVDLDI